MTDGSAAAQTRIVEDRFVLTEEVGDGRMSTVYLAKDGTNDDLEVAVKILNTAHPDEIKRELFKREIGALRKLRHPNIVGLRDSGWSADENAFYIVLDYIPYSLDRHFRGNPAPPIPIDTYRIMRDLADALANAHSEGVIHRDIKPSNVLLDSSGRALLTDFGISKLMTHLTVGETLAGFWSNGYAAPEQRSGEPATFASDVYSLGAVFFYMLSGEVPPPEGPTASLVQDRIQGPFRRVLSRMLADRPEERPRTGAELMSQLDVTRRHEKLPTYPVILTRNAIRDLLTAGHIGGDGVSEAKQFLLEEFGGEEVEEVHILTQVHNGERDVIVLGDSVRAICAVTEGGDALVAKTVHTPYDPYLQREKQGAMRRRAQWEVVGPGEGRGTGSSHREHVQSLLAELSTFETSNLVSKERRRGKRDVVEEWQRALRESRSRIEKHALMLPYSRVHTEPAYLRFELAKTPPDDLDWQDDMPLAAKESRESNLVPLGNLIDLQGRSVVVARHRYLLREREMPIPASGYITVNTTEALTEVRRQQRAVDAFLFDQMANPTLAAVIVDSSGTTQMSKPELDFFQTRLSEDKKEVVRRAISTNDLFLIKGPPGTGKTTVIAEIVLQILHRDPGTRILLTSQSNVAVDHALTQIAAAADETPPEMVRIGRIDRIGHGGEQWTLTERTRAWREHVLAQCAPVEDELRLAERAARRAAKDADRVEEKNAEAVTDLEEWIAEAGDIADQLGEYEQEYATLGAETATSNRADVKQIVDEVRSELRNHLEALNGMLPQPVDISGIAEDEALTLIVAKAATLVDESDAEAADSGELARVQELRRIVNHWRTVVGRSRDFEDLVSKSARVVAATCSISAKLNPRGSSADVSFDWAIVDEAGRATVPEVLIPIVMAQRVILVGDERQLPPMIDENMGRIAKDQAATGFETSLFQDLLEQEVASRQHVAGLETQYRMHPAIGNLISDAFYEGALVNGDVERTHRFADSFPAVVNWISTSRLRDKAESRSGESFDNIAEATVVAAVLERIQKDGGRKRELRVGVISGYKAQVGRLRGLIDTTDLQRWSGMSIDIATVDSFQGRECDVVIYSTVRSNAARKIGFLRDYRRLNVALSRARDLLIIVGDDFMMENAVLGTASNPFSGVLNHIRTNPDECRIVDAGTMTLQC